MKIKKYVTVCKETTEELDEAIGELIKQGYQPYGNPYTGNRLNKAGLLRCMIYQAMFEGD